MSLPSFSQSACDDPQSAARDTIAELRDVLGNVLEDAGIPLADRTGVLDSAWRLLPDVAREDAPAAARLKAELQALVGPTGPSPESLEDWRKRFPPPKPPKKKTERARKAPRAEEDDVT